MTPTAARRARAYLVAVAEPPAAALVRLVAAVGPEVAAERVRRGVVDAEVARETRARHAQDPSEAHLRAATALGARLLTPEDDDWPVEAFAACELAGQDHLAAPLALWIKGGGNAGLDAAVERSAAVVGARAATGYGSHVATELGYGLAEADCAVVSGAAYGIDGAAHRGALAAAGTTIAVLACGLDRPYPAGHARLLAEIAATGMVVSEYPPGAVPARHRFLVRNRLIAALAGGTVVVEAGMRSGARRTASDAGLLGRPVLAVPGPVTSALSAGCHDLMREAGALVVTRAEEVVEAVGRIGIDLAGPRPDTGPARPTDALDALTLRIHDALPALPSSAPRSVQRLSVDSGLPVEVVRVAVGKLERAGLAERARGAWRRVPERRRADA